MFAHTETHHSITHKYIHKHWNTSHTRKMLQDTRTVEIMLPDIRESLIPLSSCISLRQRAVTRESHQLLAFTEQAGYLIWCNLKQRLHLRPIKFQQILRRYNALVRPWRHLSNCGAHRALLHDFCPDAACKPLPCVPHVLLSVFVCICPNCTQCVCALVQSILTCFLCVTVSGYFLCICMSLYLFCEQEQEEITQSR